MDENSKLLLITPDFPPKRGGVARYLSTLADFFSGQITVIANEDPSWQTFDPNVAYPIYRMPLLYKVLWPKWWKVTKYLKSIKNDYNTFLVSHILPFGSAAMFANVPYVLFVHGMDIRLAGKSAKKRKMALRVMQKAKLVVANSQALADELSRDFGIGALVVYPSVPTSIEKPAVDEYNDELMFLSVSRLVERKGHTRVLNALASLKRSGRIPSFKYHIVGTGPMEHTLKSMVHELGLESVVKFYGDVSEAQLHVLYLSSDVFLLPVSNDPVDKEGFGFVFLEAALRSTPSITSNIPGVNEAVIDSQTGLLIDPNNEDDLVQKILLLATNVEYRHQLGDAARKRAIEEFNVQNQLAKLIPYL
jgi:phosphatidyl-myo-inositol dimannoside synthase